MSSLSYDRGISAAPSVPSLEVERTLHAQGFRYVAAMDEVGRGALAGPLSLGVVVVDVPGTQELSGVRDSKLLKPYVREELVPRIQEWAVCYSVAHATSVEIDNYGVTMALKLAGLRAYRSILEQGCVADCIIVDGKFNILESVGSDLPASSQDLDGVANNLPRVITRVKADMTCTSVAAASILAKVKRDSFMGRLGRLYPVYHWERNKGYGTVQHRAAIKEHGTTPFHRLSWKLL